MIAGFEPRRNINPVQCLPLRCRLNQSSRSKTCGAVGITSAPNCSSRRSAFRTKSSNKQSNSCSARISRQWFGLEGSPLWRLAKLLRALADVVVRRNMRARPRGDLIGLTAHDVVAFAGRLLETPPIDFDQAPPIWSPGEELGNLLCHGRSSHPEQLGKRVLS